MGKDSRIFKFRNDRRTEEITAKKFAKKDWTIEGKPDKFEKI